MTMHSGARAGQWREFAAVDTALRVAWIVSVAGAGHLSRPALVGNWKYL